MKYTKEKEIAQKSLEYAKKHGADNARVSLNIGIQNSFSILDNKLDRLQSANDRSLFIQLYCNGRYGTYSTNRLEAKELDTFIGEAVKGTSLLTPDEFRMLPAKELYYTENGADLQQYDSYILTMQPEEKKRIAFEACAEIYGTNKKIVSVGAEYGDVLEYQYMADSQGFEGESLQSNFSLSVECSVKGRGNARPEGWWYDSVMQYSEFSPKGIGSQALERALKKLNSKRVKSAKLPMVVDATCASRLISPIFSALNGASIHQKNSFLIDSLDKKIFTDKFNLIDTPHQIGMQGARYFDGEGIATKPLNIIDKGVVNTYFVNTYNAAKLGIKPTIEGVSIPRLDTSAFSKELQNINGEQMPKLLGKGIYVTGFNGGNCNGGTGDFSFGVEGFYFENGELLFPVKELNISGNMISLWKNLALVGSDARKCTRWQIPSLAFNDVDFTGL